MTPEINDIEFGDVLHIYFQHADAVRILAENGWEIPKTPDGCNTVTFYFETKDGLQAVAINQSGFRLEASDNEQEVNGCMVIVCLDKSRDLIDARKLLQQVINQILTS